MLKDGVVFVDKREMAVIASQLKKINRALADAALLAEEIYHSDAYQLLANKDREAHAEVGRRFRKKLETAQENPVDSMYFAGEFDDVVELISTLGYES